MTNIKQIEADQIRRFDERRINMYKLIKNKSIKKQIKYIGDKLKFMFKNDDYGKLSADIQVFQLMNNSPLTLNTVQALVLKSGQKAASKGATIEQFLKVIKEECLKINNENPL